MNTTPTNRSTHNTPPIAAAPQFFRIFGIYPPPHIDNQLDTAFCVVKNLTFIELIEWCVFKPLFNKGALSSKDTHNIRPYYLIINIRNKVVELQRISSNGWFISRYKH